MEQIEVLDYKKIDVSKIQYSEPDKVKGGSFMSLVTYDDKPLYIQTPRLINNKGIVKTDTRSSLDLEFDKSHALFYDFITSVDDNNINTIHTNSGLWFSKSFELDLVEEFYKTPIKVARKNMPPIFKLKLPTIKGNISCSIFNSDNNIISYRDVETGTKMVCLLKLQGLRFLKQQVVCEWVPVQIKVFQKNKQNSEYLIKESLMSDFEGPKQNNEIISNNINLKNLENSDELIEEEIHIRKLNSEPSEDNELNLSKSILESQKSSSEPVPVTEEPVAVLEEPVPVPEEPVPVLEEPVPVQEEQVPVTEEPVPVTESEPEELVDVKELLEEPYEIEIEELDIDLDKELELKKPESVLKESENLENNEDPENNKESENNEDPENNEESENIYKLKNSINKKNIEIELLKKKLNKLKDLLI